MSTASTGTQTPPTGQQWTIGHGRQEVVVTEVGATLRSYTVGSMEVIDGFDVSEWSHGGRGQVLAPWPNRLGDGRYRFGDVEGRAAWDEPERRNAIHGLVRWLPWGLEAHAQNVLTASCRLHPSPGYPFTLDLSLTYRLGREGLSVAAEARNPGSEPAPFGIGFHPYVTVGQQVDTAYLRVPATEHLVVDDRGLPTGERRAVAGSPLDFTSRRALGSLCLDTAFTGLLRDSHGPLDGADGVARAILADGSGSRSVEVWCDGAFGYLMCYTGDTLVPIDRRRRAVAIEPMSCPPDALRSGHDLAVIEPGGTWRGSWGITPG